MSKLLCWQTLLLFLSCIQNQILAWTVYTAPADMQAYGSYIGQSFCFYISAIGATTTADRIWGNMTYTSDSPLKTTVVHSGWLSRAQTGQLQVLVQAGQNSYPSVLRNGISSITYAYWGLSYSYVDYCCSDGKYNIAGSPTCYSKFKQFLFLIKIKKLVKLVVRLVLVVQVHAKLALLGTVYQAPHVHSALLELIVLVEQAHV